MRSDAGLEGGRGGPGTAFGSPALLLGVGSGLTVLVPVRSEGFGPIPHTVGREVASGLEGAGEARLPLGGVLMARWVSLSDFSVAGGAAAPGA